MLPLLFPALSNWRAPWACAFDAPVKKQGFVLVMTLWILAAITIVAGFFALWVERALTSATQMQAEVQAQIDIHSTRETVAYLFASRWFTVAGLTLPESDDEGRLRAYSDEEVRSYGIAPIGTELRFDDQVYQGLGQARFSIQDQDGLMTLDAANPYTSPRIFARFLDLLGVDPAQRDPLIAKLADYQDPDDFHRINGAESTHYQEAGQLPPTNRLLRTPLEVKRVLDWPEQTVLWRDGLWEHLTKAHGTVYANANTAPAIVLQAVYGWPPELAQHVIGVRPISDYQILRELGVAMDGRVEPPPIFSSRFFRLSFWHEHSARMQRIFFELNHGSDHSPWQVQYAYDFPLRAAYAATPPLFPDTALLQSHVTQSSPVPWK
jgi:general secretion pathway protein K